MTKLASDCRDGMLQPYSLQAVLQVIPLCIMQTSKIPMSICDKVKIIVDLLFGVHTGNIEKFTNLTDVCMPRAKGGLGLKDLHTMKRALLLKLAWDLLKDKESLWVCVMLARCNIEDIIRYDYLPD